MTSILNGAKFTVSTLSVTLIIMFEYVPIFELEGVPEQTAKEALLLAGYKLPVKVRFAKKN